MNKYKVREMQHSTAHPCEDKAFDQISLFETYQEAHVYYLKVFKSNYFTDLQEFIKEKWQYKASSCCSQFA